MVRKCIVDILTHVFIINTQVEYIESFTFKNNEEYSFAF